MTANQRAPPEYGGKASERIPGRPAQNRILAGRGLAAANSKTVALVAAGARKPVVTGGAHRFEPAIRATAVAAYIVAVVACLSGVEIAVAAKTNRWACSG